MSIPISVCMIRKALTDDEVLQELQTRLKYNKKFGSMLIWDCKDHVPKCGVLTKKENEILNEGLKKLDQTKS